MDHVEILCENLLILDKGKVLLQGNLQEILETYEIKGKKNNSLNDIFIDKVGKEYE